MLTNILRYEYKYNIYIYDKNWYLSGDIKILEYDMSFIYKHFEEMREILLKERKGYIFKINDTDINNLMFISKFNFYVVSLMRNSIVELTETEEFKALNKDNEFNIHTGKFYDKFDIIYIESKYKNIIKIKRKIEKEEKYVNKDLKNLELVDINFKAYDLRWTDFRNSELINLNLSYKILVGAKFENCKFTKNQIEIIELSKKQIEEI